MKLREKYLKYGTVQRQDFVKVVSNPNGLWYELMERGYISEKGFLQSKFRELKSSVDIELSAAYKNKKNEIRNVLNGVQKKATVIEWIESIAVAFILAMLIRTFIIQAFKIPTGSMRMTLLEGDRILVNKLRYGPHVPFTHTRLPGLTHPKRGDVVVFVYPEDHKRDFIKRLIGRPGETVEIRQGRIYINDRPVEDPAIKSIYYYNRGDYGGPDQKIKVPENSYFVMGDNSGSSRDSRYWGFVPEDLLIGRAEVIYWPLNRIRFIK